MPFPSKALVALSISMAAACADEGAASSATPLAQGIASSPTDAGVPTPKTAVSGTKVSGQCKSYSAADADAGMCAGYYCGATEAQVIASMPADSVCPHPAFLCGGTIVSAVRACTRTVVIANLGMPLDPLKPEIQDCVYENEVLKDTVTPACLGCYLNAATCAASNCLVDCLSDSPACDACRAKNNCDEPVYTCSKTPSPF